MGAPHYIARQLRAARILARRSQRDVASAVAVNQSTVSEWETGAVVPTLTSVLKWAATLGYELTLTRRAAGSSTENGETRG